MSTKTNNNEKKEELSFCESSAPSIMEYGVEAIRKRAAYKKQLLDAADVVLVPDIDEKTGEQKREKPGDKNSAPLWKEENKYSDSIRIAGVASVLTRAIVGAMNDRNASSLVVPSLGGKVCVCKSTVNELRAYQTVHSKHTEEGIEYAFIDFSLNNGCIRKEDLTGFNGSRFGGLIIDALGVDTIKQMVINASPAVSNLSPELINFMSSHKPGHVNGILIKNALSAGALTGGNYKDAVVQYARLIKSDAREAGIITASQQKSRNLTFLVESKIKELYPEGKPVEESEN